MNPLNDAGKLALRSTLFFFESSVSQRRVAYWGKKCGRMR
jgi:hypothetical protein